MNPNVELHRYVAVYISQLLPGDVAHMDTSALLQELAFLCSEVCAIGAVRAELEEVKSTLKCLRAEECAVNRVTEEVSVLWQEIQQLQHEPQGSNRHTAEGR